MNTKYIAAAIAATLAIGSATAKEKTDQEIINDSAYYIDSWRISATEAYCDAFAVGFTDKEDMYGVKFQSIRIKGVDSIIFDFFSEDLTKFIADKDLDGMEGVLTINGDDIKMSLLMKTPNNKGIAGGFGPGMIVMLAKHNEFSFRLTDPVKKRSFNSGRITTVNAHVAANWLGFCRGKNDKELAKALRK